MAPAARPLHVVLHCGDSTERARRCEALHGLILSELADESKLQQVLQENLCDVLVWCGSRLPDLCWQADHRWATVWLAPGDSVGPVDALLPPDVSDTDLRHCVELVGVRAVLMREIEALAHQVEETFGRHKWRGGRLGRSHGELLQLALSDPLTGVFNRRYLDQTLRSEFDRAKSAGKPLSVLIIDLDRFKPVNETWGHRAGDLILCQVATRLQRATRGSDVVCRYGGDEFTVICLDSDARSGAMLAERLRLAIANSPFQTEGLLIPLTCSIGVASLPPSQVPTADALLHEADLAMFDAKRRGGDFVCQRSNSVGSTAGKSGPGGS